MASPSLTHVSATPGMDSVSAGMAEQRWLGEFESPLSSDSGASSGRSFAERIRRAWSGPGEAAEPGRRRFAASPVRFPNPSSPRRPAAAASPIRFPTPPPVAAEAPESSRQAANRRPGPAAAASAAHAAPRVDVDGFEQPHGRLYRRANRRSASPPSPPPPAPPARPVPADLWGLYFNCCRPGHKSVDCWYESRCLRCHEEGHRAADLAICLGRRSPSAVEDPRPAQRRRESSPPHQQLQPRRAPGPAPPERILGRNPQAQDNHDMASRAASATPTSPAPSAGRRPPSRAEAAVLCEPPSLDVLMQHRPDRALCYVRRSPAITEAESTLADAVTITIVGSRPPVSRAQLAEAIASRFNILEDLFDVYAFAPEDFLVHFSNSADRNRVLAVSGVISAPNFKFTAKP
ncbi:hypothetical protein ACQ4PT_070198 [Festuca glaucescens]